MGDESSSSAAGEALTTVLLAWGSAEVAEELGASEDAAALVGLGVAAGYSSGAFSSNETTMPSAGGKTGAAGTAAGSSGPRSGFDYSIPSLRPDTSQASLGGAAPPPPPSANTPVESGPLVSGQVSAPSSQPPSAGGMLSQGAQGDLSMGSRTPAPVQRASPGTETSSQVIASETVGRVERPDAKPSWWERVFSDGKTMDLLMAGMAGAGEAGMREFEIERPYKREDELAKRWKRTDPGGGGLLRMGQSMPSTRR